MAKTNNTPVTFWLSLTLPDLIMWIKDSNAIVKELANKRNK